MTFLQILLQLQKLQALASLAIKKPKSALVIIFLAVLLGYGVVDPQHLKIAMDFLNEL